MRTRGTEDDQGYRLTTRNLMEERGIALNPIEIIPARVLRLQVSQDAAPLTSLLFRAEGAAECCLWLKIVNHAAAPIRLKHVGLELPFTKQQFAWQKDPLRVTGQSFYRLPFSRDVFNRDEVINHHLSKNLLPGIPIQGFVLGLLQEPIPEHVAGQICGRLRILDRMGNEYSQRVCLYIDTRVFRSKSSTPASLKLGGAR
jgi:hypothetical protein